jgi:hypothetical protein
MQAIPHDEVVEPAEGRYLMRRSLGNILPDRIVRRKGKGNPEEVIARAFVREWPRLRPLFVQSRIQSRNYVDEDAFLSAVEGYRQGKTIPIGMVLKLLSLEVWLRGLESPKANWSNNLVTTYQADSPQTVLEPLMS